MILFLFLKLFFLFFLFKLAEPEKPRGLVDSLTRYFTPTNKRRSRVAQASMTCDFDTPLSVKDENSLADGASGSDIDLSDDEHSSDEETENDVENKPETSDKAKNFSTGYMHFIFIIQVHILYVMCF